MMMMIVVLRCGVAVMAARCRDRAPWWLYESDAERQPWGAILDFGGLRIDPKAAFPCPGALGRSAGR